MPETAPPERERNRLAVAYSSTLMAGIAAASFACILTLIALQRTDETARRAMLAFCIALPIVLSYRLVTNDPARKYHVSCLHRTITALGMFAFMMGLAIMIDSISRLAAVVFIVLCVTSCWIADAAEQRAKKQAAKAKRSDTTDPSNTP